MEQIRRKLRRKSRPSTGERKVSEADVIGAFGEDAAARLSGLSLAQLRMWDRTGFMRPSFADENRRQPFSRVYSFRDIVSLRVLGRLRNELGVPLQHLRQVSEKLASMGDAKWTATTLYVLGKRVVFDDPRSKERKEIVSGQRVFDIPLRVAISDTRQAIGSLNERGTEDAGKVDRDKFVMQNDPVFSGTRIPVAAVQRYLAAGFEPSQIISEFPGLTEADVKAAKEFGDGSRAA